MKCTKCFVWCVFLPAGGTKKGPTINYLLDIVASPLLGCLGIASRHTHSTQCLLVLKWQHFQIYPGCYDQSRAKIWRKKLGKGCLMFFLIDRPCFPRLIWLNKEKNQVTPFPLIVCFPNENISKYTGCYEISKTGNNNKSMSFLIDSPPDCLWPSFLHLLVIFPHPPPSCHSGSKIERQRIPWCGAQSHVWHLPAAMTFPDWLSLKLWLTGLLSQTACFVSPPPSSASL